MQDHYMNVFQVKSKIVTLNYIMDAYKESLSVLRERFLT